MHKSRGRPQRFRADAVVDGAVGVFWRRGYEGASLADLEQGAGANRSTLYASFGGKHGLFLRALGRYQDQLGERMLRPLEQGTDGLADVHAFLERFAEQLTGPDGAVGCLMVNSMTEFAGADPAVVAQADAYLERVRRALTATLRRAVDRGEVPPHGNDGRVDAFLALIIGMNATARAGLPVAQLRAMLQGAHQQVRDWHGLTQSA